MYTEIFQQCKICVHLLVESIIHTIQQNIYNYLKIITHSYAIMLFSISHYVTTLEEIFSQKLMSYLRVIPPG